MVKLDITSQIGIYKFLMALVLCLVFCASACRQQETQIDIEHETAVMIRKFLSIYEAQFPSAPVTNIAQAFMVMDLSRPTRMHPYYLQERFRSFGKYAGFQNSIYEKYIVLPSGGRARTRFGEVGFLNAEPFPNAKGQFGRFVASKIGKGYENSRVDWFEESQIQLIFKEASDGIPNVEFMPPPTSLPPMAADSIVMRVRKYYRDVAGNLGIGRGSWWIVLSAYVGIAGVILGFLFIWFSKGRRT